MNIFYLSNVPQLCAKYHCDKHVVKMITEYYQILFANLHIMKIDIEDYKTEALKLKAKYKPDSLIKFTPFNPNHTNTIWARQSLENFLYVRNLAYLCALEHKYRFSHPSDYYHFSWRLIEILPIPDKNNFPYTRFTTPVTAMPDHCKISNDPIICYRYYYLKEKYNFVSWKNRAVPLWYNTTPKKYLDRYGEFDV